MAVLGEKPMAIDSNAVGASVLLTPISRPNARISPQSDPSVHEALARESPATMCDFDLSHTRTNQADKRRTRLPKPKVANSRPVVRLTTGSSVRPAEGHPHSGSVLASLLMLRVRSISMEDGSS
jgi:hypothetical protein